MASSPTLPPPPSISEEELEEELTDVGNKLLKPPSSTDELLKLLDVRPPFLVFHHKDLIFMCTLLGLIDFVGLLVICFSFRDELMLVSLIGFVSCEKFVIFSIKV